MTDQIQSGMLAMMQVMAAQSQVPQVGTRKTGEDQVDFQKMLEQKSQNQPAKEETKPQQPEKAQQAEEAPEQSAQQTQNEGQTQEDGHAMVKRLAEAGMIPVDAANAYLMQAQQPVQQPETELQVVALVQDGQPVVVTPELQQPGQMPELAQAAEVVPLEQVQPEQVLQTVQQEQQPVQQNPVAEALPDQQEAVQQQPILAEQAEPQQQEEQQDGLEQADLSQSAQPLFRDVEAAPIKVGEAYQPEETQQADVSQQIAGPLNQALAQGQSKVEIHLNPEYLGSVKVEITQSAEGILRVALTAESSETRGLLEKHAANLQSLLGREQQTVEVEVQRQENGQQPQDNPYEEGHNGQNRQQPRQRQQQKGDSQDFLQKLRLGLTPVEADR